MLRCSTLLSASLCITSLTRSSTKPCLRLKLGSVMGWRRVLANITDIYTFEAELVNACFSFKHGQIPRKPDA